MAPSALLRRKSVNIKILSIQTKWIYRDTATITATAETILKRHISITKFT